MTEQTHKATELVAEIDEYMDRLERLAAAAKDDIKTDLFAARSAGFIGRDRWSYYAAANPFAILLLIKQVRTALSAPSALPDGAGWRPISEYDKTPDSLGLTKTVILGFAPDEIGETLPSTAGYWRQEEWKGCEPCFVSCIDPDTPYKPAQPTHCMEFPTPPEASGEE